MDKYEDYCSICGFALTNDNCAVNIEGTIIDFIKKDKGVINITLCHDCWNKLFEVHSGGMERAISKSEVLRRDNYSQSLEIKKWKERDEEGGGPPVRIPPA
jgi:hypothetical protein